MLTLTRCRDILGTTNELSDAELLILREQLYEAARAFLDFVHREGPQEATRSLGRETRFRDVLSEVTEDQEAIEETAAILEFDGGLERDRAERTAVVQYLKGRRQQD